MKMKSALHGFVPFFAVAALSFEAADTAATNVPPDYRYKADVLLEDIPQPMGIKFAPDGRIFFNEYRGKLKIYHLDTKQVVEAGALDVWADQENGFLGFALDPQFEKNGWIYCLYSPSNYPGQYLSRFTMKGETLDRESEKVLLKFEEQRRECCHHAGSVEFGPDGCLYFSTGDNTHPFGDSASYAPLDERPGREPWDAQKSAGNTHSFSGKIIRIRPKLDGTYEIPQGNLFPPGDPKTLPEIFAMGCRNPWRMSIDEKTGFVYWGEVGPDARDDGPRGSRGYDEINQARKAGNFGWPYFVGDNFAYTQYDYETKTLGEKFDALHPVNNSVNNTGLRDLPPAQPAFIFWPYGASERFPMLGSGGRTACAGPVFHYRKEFEKTGGFPDYFDNCLLFWDWERRFVKWARLDKDSNLVGIEPFSGIISQGATKVKRVVSAKFGPDGCLYVMDYGESWGANHDSKLIRISYQHGALAPIAVAGAVNAVGREPLTVSLSSEGSKDLEGQPLRFEWWLQPDNKLVATNAAAQITIARPGDYRAELRVIKSPELVSSATVPITVGNTPPVVEFETPKDGDFFMPGEPVAYRVRVADAEDDLVPANAAEIDVRTVISAARKTGGGNAETDRGLTLMKQSNCFNCHAVEQKVVGPSLVEVADKYRGQAAMVDVIAQRVQKGSSGVWGPIPMLPHPEHTLDEIHIMLGWLLALEKEKNTMTILRGRAGTIATSASQSGALAIEASYTDHGRQPVGSLTSKATVTLMPRRIEAESGRIAGARPLSGASASGKTFVGAINHGHHVCFPNINLAAVGGITARVASGGAGACVEFRAGSPTGDLLGAITVPVTGGWENWIELKTALDANAPRERKDVFAVFVNPGQSGLMNLDWVQFDPR